MLAAAVLGPASPVFFFFNDTATTEISPLPLHAALPIFPRRTRMEVVPPSYAGKKRSGCSGSRTDRKSTRLNSSHVRNLVCRLLLEKKKPPPEPVDVPPHHKEAHLVHAGLHPTPCDRPYP